MKPSVLADIDTRIQTLTSVKEFLATLPEETPEPWYIGDREKGKIAYTAGAPDRMQRIGKSFGTLGWAHDAKDPTRILKTLDNGMVVEIDGLHLNPATVPVTTFE